MRLRCLLAALSFLLAAASASAERCKMVGCRGLVGYVFVPTVDQVSGDKLSWNGKAYPITSHLFGEAGLAKVNDEVKIGRDARLLDETTVRAYLADFHDQGLAWDEPDEGSLLDAGARVRVLAYTTFTAPARSQHLLFALVQVKAD